MFQAIISMTLKYHAVIHLVAPVLLGPQLLKALTWNLHFGDAATFSENLGQVPTSRSSGQGDMKQFVSLSCLGSKL